MARSVSIPQPVAHAGVPRGAVRVCVDVAAAPPLVWDALTRAESVARWFGDLSASLTSGVSAQLDFGDADFFALTNVHAEPPRRLRYDWRFLGRGALSRVAWDVAAAPAGSTVTVTDTDPERSPETVAELTTGWTDFLQRLERHLATGEVTRYDWRRSFEGSTLLHAPVAIVAASLFGAGVEGRWMPFGGDAVVDGATVCVGDVPERYALSGVERGVAHVRFALRGRTWQHATHCALHVTAHGGDALLFVEQTGWDDIGAHASPMHERRRFAECWIAALDRATNLL